MLPTGRLAPIRIFRHHAITGRVDYLPRTARNRRDPNLQDAGDGRDGGGEHERGARVSVPGRPGEQALAVRQRRDHRQDQHNHGAGLRPRFQTLHVGERFPGGKLRVTEVFAFSTVMISCWLTPGSCRCSVCPHSCSLVWFLSLSLSSLFVSGCCLLACFRSRLILLLYSGRER